MKIAISGVNGFVGNELKKHFLSKKYEVIDILRSDLQEYEELKQKINQADIVINLAGANIIKRWTTSYKKEILQSRVNSTSQIVKAINETNNVKLFFSTSAIGIHGDGFLKDVCTQWEAKANEANVRSVIFRFGIVLGNGGALNKMLTPFKLGVGGTIGDGSQPFSFIHISDLIGAYEFTINNPHINGTFDLVAPTPTTNYEFTKTLGKALNRPTFLPLPKFVLWLMFGEGSTVLTEGQSIEPIRLLEEGFEFKYGSIEEALSSLV